MKANVFDVSVEEVAGWIAINLDKDGKPGGYISVKFRDNDVVVDIFSFCGDLLGSTWALYNELEPITEEVQQ